MRHNLRHFCLSLLGLGAAIAPTLSHAQWEVRPAPPSWGLPAPTPKAAPMPSQSAMPQQSYNPAPASSATSPATFNDALACSAALQVATMAAPNWARERGITNITNAWLQKVFALGEPQGVTGDKVPSLVESEMQSQINAAANDPSRLSRKAFDCASRQP